MGPGLRWLCLLVVLTTSTVACGSGAAPVSGVLRVPIVDRIGVPDPAIASNQWDFFVDSLLYSGLMKFSPDLHVIPELAVSIPTISNNGLSYTFTIRHDAEFADGTACTARDVAYSLTRALWIDGPVARRYLGNIAGAREVEDHASTSLAGVRVVHRLTLRIHLSQPDADFLQKLAFPVAFVVNRRIVPMSRLLTWPTRTAGTGPWMLSVSRGDGARVLSPRPDFYGGPLNLRSLVLQPVRDNTDALSRYRKGNLDVTPITTADAPGLAGRSDYHETAALEAYYALPESGNALDLAEELDRDRLVQGTALTSLSTVVPPAVPDYVPSAPGLDPTSPRTATQIVVASPGDPISRQLKRAIAAQVPAVRPGKREIQPTQRLRLIRASNLLPDPSVWLWMVVPHTHSRWYRTSLADADRLTDDPVTRMGTFNKMEQWALAKGLIVPLASGTVSYLIKPSVQSLQVTPFGIMPDNNNWSTVAVT